MTVPIAPAPELRTMAVAGGRIAYDVAGSGPLVVLVPGMGDLRSTYRQVAPHLRRSGYRVAVTDLRGHGDSDAGFDAYGDVATAGDIVALIEELDGPAVVMGNSMGAGAAALAAASRPDLVSGLVLVGPFVRDASVSAIKRLLFRLVMARPWASWAWSTYLPSLYAGTRPDDLDEHLDAIRASMRKPGHARAFWLTTRTTHAPVEARLGELTCPTLVVMGTQDPDFPDPRAEAEWIAATTHGRVLMVDDAAHYPHTQRPDVVVPALVDFLTEASRDV